MVVPHYYKELYGNTWKATWQNRMCERQQDDVVAGKFIQAFNTGTKSAHFLAKKPMLTTKSMNDIHNLPDVPHTSSFWERREKSRKFKVYLTGTESSSRSNNESRLFLNMSDIDNSSEIWGIHILTWTSTSDFEIKRNKILVSYEMLFGIHQVRCHVFNCLWPKINSLVIWLWSCSLSNNFKFFHNSSPPT